MDNFINELNNSGVQNIVLFCVEEHAEACHRSLVAQLLAKKLETKVINL